LGGGGGGGVTVIIIEFLVPTASQLSIRV
jgi:hypothetical protein